MINKIALAGCGNVGTALLEILHEKKDELREKYGFEYKVVLVSDLMKGVIMDPEGLDLGAALESVRETRTFEKLPRAEGSFEELLERSGATVLAEGTPTNLKTGKPGLTHIRAALSRGISVTTTNKGPIALAFDELTELAKANGAQLSYEGVVMSGTPLIDMMKNGVAGCSVLKLEGRGRSEAYVSTVTRVYKEAAEACVSGEWSPEKVAAWEDELLRVFNRQFWHGGYYLGEEWDTWSGCSNSLALEQRRHLGRVMRWYARPQVAEIRLEAEPLSPGGKIEITGPTTGIVRLTVPEVRVDDEDGNTINVSTAPKGAHALVPVGQKVRHGDKVYLVTRRKLT